MQKIYTFIGLVFIFSSSISFPQYLNIRVDDPQNTSHNEVTIAINPLNPNVLAGGANINNFYSSSVDFENLIRELSLGFELPYSSNSVQVT